MAKSPKDRSGPRGKPVSLHPLALKDALAALVATKPAKPARPARPGPRDATGGNTKSR